MKQDDNENLNCSLTQAKEIKKLIDVIKDLVNDVNIECTPDGMSLAAMDTAHVSLIQFTLNSKFFDRYSCKEPCTIGINLGNLNTHFKGANDKDSIIMKNTTGGDVLSLAFVNGNEKNTQTKIRLIDIEADTLGIPDTEYDATIRMPANEFKKTIDYLKTLGDMVTIKANKTAVTFSTRGDTGEADSVLRTSSSREDKNAIIIETKGETKTTFALKYLHHFAKAEHLTDTVHIYLHKEHPILVEFKIGKDSFLRFYLAPKIDEDFNDDDFQEESSNKRKAESDTEDEPKRKIQKRDEIEDDD
jgi:proliferating cell nuclear antigen